MKAPKRLRAALCVLGALTLAPAASAQDAAIEPVRQATEEIVVYGTPIEPVLDAVSLRIDLDEHAGTIASSIRDALAKSEPRVARAAAERG